jgi:hypothetical protein
VPLNFLIIKAARKASKMLKGTAIYKSPNGSTLIFATTNHIRTKATNHERKVVCNKENFFEIIKMAMAKHKDQTPQTAPFMGSAGKTIPRLS